MIFAERLFQQVQQAVESLHVRKAYRLLLNAVRLQGTIRSLTAHVHARNWLDCHATQGPELLDVCEESCGAARCAVTILANFHDAFNWRLAHTKHLVNIHCW